MSNVASLAEVASLIGEPARTAMLVTLMDGRALTAGELGTVAGVTPSTASGHLARLHTAGLLALESQGRHRYYRLAGADVAATLEGLMSLACELDATRRPVRTGPRDPALRRARLCYDHLAGEAGVALADALVSTGRLRLGPDGGALSDEGRTVLCEAGVELPAGEGAGLCRICLDWSERRPHIGGVLGRSLFDALARQGWVRRAHAGRAVTITPSGAVELRRRFGVTLG